MWFVASQHLYRQFLLPWAWLPPYSSEVSCSDLCLLEAVQTTSLLLLLTLHFLYRNHCSWPLHASQSVKLSGLIFTLDCGTLLSLLTLLSLPFNHLRTACLRTQRVNLVHENWDSLEEKDLGRRKEDLLILFLPLLLLGRLTGKTEANVLPLMFCAPQRSHWQPRSLTWGNSRSVMPVSLVSPFRTTWFSFLFSESAGLPSTNLIDNACLSGISVMKGEWRNMICFSWSHTWLQTKWSL